MTELPKSVAELVSIVKSSQSRLAATRDQSMTQIQREQATKRVHGELAKEGIFDCRIDWQDYLLSIAFRSMRVAGSGAVADVSPAGICPISIRADSDHTVSVRFEPRDVSEVPDYRQFDVDNREFHHLHKGSAIDFGGRVRWGRYWFGAKQEFEFTVYSDTPRQFSLGAWLRKKWDGSLPGIRFTDE